MNYLTDNEWGIAVTIAALLMILGIFGSALWFIFHASDTNRRFRWLQALDRWNRKRRGSREGASTDRSRGGSAGP